MAKAKTIFLVLLVATSVVLSVTLMIGQVFPGGVPEHQPVYFSPRPDIGELSIPSRIQVVGLEGQINQIQTFSETYTTLVISLSQLDYGAVDEGEVWSLAEQLPSPYAPGVLFRFDYPLTRGLLAGLLSNFHTADFPFDTVDMIFVPYGVSQDTDQQDTDQQQFGQVFFINEEEQEAWVLTGNLTRTLYQNIVTSPAEVLDIEFTVLQPGATYDVAPRVFDAATTYTIQIPPFQREDIDRSALVRAFNLDSSITRLIQEMDGAELFTDGLQALRIFPSGELEYTVAKRQHEGLIPAQRDAIDASLDFVTKHGGWPGDILLSQVSPLPGGQTKLHFTTVGMGLPLYGTHTGINITMDGLSVSYYGRNLFFVERDEYQDTYEVRPFSVLLEDASTAVSQRISALDETIQDLSLGFYWRHQTLHVVWRVSLENGFLLVSARDGSILEEDWPGGVR